MSIIAGELIDTYDCPFDGPLEDLLAVWCDDSGTSEFINKEFPCEKCGTPVKMFESRV